MDETDKMNRMVMKLLSLNHLEDLNAAGNNGNALKLGSAATRFFLHFGSNG